MACLSLELKERFFSVNTSTSVICNIAVSLGYAHCAYRHHARFWRQSARGTQLVNQFVEEIIAPCVYPAARECLAQHRANGDRIVIISASGEHLVTPIARYLGVDESLSIGVVIQEECFTGLTQGVMSYREGKVIRLLELINQDTAQLRNASFYSDSNNDLPLLSQVGRPIVVNPDAILLQHAQQAGWPVYRWS